eukprot:GEMP01048114.1.p1 GENE.GEMP01048114.1~~GEMP01048114.1.p1  ORF type:complete len:405 (+),score=58.03 GEMP01048114.1:59-1273(+)
MFSKQLLLPRQKTNMILRETLRSVATAAGRRADPLLFTPGPITTSSTVKEAMLHDLGSRDIRFLDVVQTVRQRLLKIANAGKEYECVIMQGSGTMGVESVLGSVIPRAGKVLILNNGAYGERQKTICKYLSIDYESIDVGEAEATSVSELAKRLQLQDSPTFSHVSMIHHETTAGVLNPVKGIAQLLQSRFPHLQLIVDSMSAFGAYELDMNWGVHYCISSSNKNLQGVPGFSFILAQRDAMLQSEGSARSLSFDLQAQWRNLEKTKQFRFTPPTHSMLAFNQALNEFDEEGGWTARGARYAACYNVLKRGMEEMGFKFYVPEDCRGYIVSTFVSPTHRNWDFTFFYEELGRKGYVIYPGKLSKIDSFRLGTIGHITPQDVEDLLVEVKAACEAMNVPLKNFYV